MQIPLRKEKKKLLSKTSEKYCELHIQRVSAKISKCLLRKVNDLYLLLEEFLFSSE